MKKMLSCAIAVIMLLSIACSALAIAVQPGETFEVAFSVEANPDNAVAATVKTNYDNTAFTQNNNNSFEGGNGQLFDLNGIKPGTELKSSFTVKDTAPSGDYNLSLSVKQASDINENSVTTLKFNNTTVTVKNPAQPVPTTQPAPTAQPVPTAQPDPTAQPVPTGEPEPTVEPDPSVSPELEHDIIIEMPVVPTPTPKPHWMHNNIRSDGPMLSDLKAGITEKWYTATIVDLSKDGRIVIPIVTGGYYQIGNAFIDVVGDSVTVTYRYNKACDDTAEYKFYTFFHDADSIEGAEYNEIEKRFYYGVSYSIANDLNGDTEVIFYMLNKAMHTL